MPNGSSRCSSLASPNAISGASTKFATSDPATRRGLRNGATISPTVSPEPMPTMLETTNASIAIGTACFRSSIDGFLRARDSQVDLQPNANQHQVVELPGARLHVLDVGAEAACGGQGGIVEDLHALLVALREPGRRERSAEQILELVRDPDAEVARA